MNMIPVVSSDLHSVGYENGTLYIRFHSGSTYAYFNVTESDYRGLMAAPSHGRFFHACIKNRYEYRRVA